MTKPWIQAAIDTTTVKEGLQLAELAVLAGADWIEAGTPLITFEGVRAIGAIAGVAGDRPVVADYKAQDGVEKYFAEAGRQGARVATVLGCVPDASIEAAIRGGRAGGVEVVADLFSISQENLVMRSKQLEALGVDYIMLHLGHDDAKANPAKGCLDGLSEVISAVCLPVGVSTFTKEEAVEAVRLGASFIVQGNPILAAPDAAERLADFVLAVKAAGREK